MPGIITLAHGSGGRGTYEILESLILSHLSDPMKRIEGGVGVDELDDGAAIPLPDGKYVVFSIDAYTVNPPFFPGGNIGELAASGTINDILMMGAKPLAILDSIVVEEGYPISELRQITNSMLEILKRYDIKLIGGDFKAMPRGNLDKILITTAGMGIAEHLIIDSNLAPGDKIIISGTIAEHGAAILAAQEGLKVEGRLKSDTEPLVDLMLPLLENYGEFIHAAQDPTRGGIAEVLNEWASKSNLLIRVSEGDVPIREEVRSFTELMGIDPFNLACEGRAVLAVDPRVAEEVLRFIRDLGFSDASIVGNAEESSRYGGNVVLKTVAGGLRLLERPTGSIVPRIC